jgi:hypothetical protein
MAGFKGIVAAIMPVAMMPTARLQAAIMPVLLVAVMLAGCAAQPALLGGTVPPHITKVTVVKTAPLGSVNMAEDLRVKILQRAPAYASTGIIKTLDVNISQLSFKNPVMAIVAGDHNRLNVDVRVIDGVTGKVDTVYESIAIDSAAINGLAGAIMSAIDDPIDIEQRLNEKVAGHVLSKLYGTDAAQRARDKRLDTRVVAQYPRNYEQLKTEARCKSINDANIASETDPNDKFHKMQGKAGPLPPECAAVGVVAKPSKRQS